MSSHTPLQPNAADPATQAAPAPASTPASAPRTETVSTVTVSMCVPLSMLEHHARRRMVAPQDSTPENNDNKEEDDSDEEERLRRAKQQQIEEALKKAKETPAIGALMGTLHSLTHHINSYNSYGFKLIKFE